MDKKTQQQRNKLRHDFRSSYPLHLMYDLLHPWAKDMEDAVELVLRAVEKHPTDEHVITTAANVLRTLVTDLPHQAEFYNRNGMRWFVNMIPQITDENDIDNILSLIPPQYSDNEAISIVMTASKHCIDRCMDTGACFKRLGRFKMQGDNGKAMLELFPHIKEASEEILIVLNELFDAGFLTTEHDHDSLHIVVQGLSNHRPIKEISQSVKLLVKIYNRNPNIDDLVQRGVYNELSHLLSWNFCNWDDISRIGIDFLERTDVALNANSFVLLTFLNEVTSRITDETLEQIPHGTVNTIIQQEIRDSTYGTQILVSYIKTRKNLKFLHYLCRALRALVLDQPHNVAVFNTVRSAIMSGFTTKSEQDHLCAYFLGFEPLCELFYSIGANLRTKEVDMIMHGSGGLLESLDIASENEKALGCALQALLALTHYACMRDLIINEGSITDLILEMRHRYPALYSTLRTLRRRFMPVHYFSRDNLTAFGACSDCCIIARNLSWKY
jgi:hypothetical protein